MRSTRKDAPETRRTVDADGVVVTERRRPSHLTWGVVVLLLAGALGWLLLEVRDRPPSGPTKASEAAVPAAREPGGPRPVLAGSAPASQDEPPEENDEKEIFLDQIDPAALEEAGERTGIGLFPPPGTKPIKGGLLVPDGFVLPPGYLRHYQATDDGEPVEAILVFHPDYKPVDAAGQPIPLPEDRIVPPDLAPPGMPLQALEPPPVRRDLDQQPPP